MPVEFLSDAEAAAYGRYAEPPSRAELENLFFLDDADRELIAKRRGEAAGWDLARYGMGATATALRRHGPSRQLATLLATVVYLEGKSVDDCLDLLDPPG